MNRRKLLSTVAPAALALSGVAAAASVTVNPDAELLALCAEYEALECKIIAANVGSTLATEDRIFEAMSGTRDRQDAIVDVIVAAPPTTPAGFAAVVRLLVIWNPDLLKDKSTQDTSERLTQALCRGIAGRGAV